MLKNLIKDNEGSALVIFALITTVLMGLSALVIDVGLLYRTEFRLTNAVDAAALAGAQELPLDTQEAVNQAVNYAVSNGLDSNELMIEVFDEDRCIKVSAEREVNLLFAPLLGFNKGKVGHTAVARVAPISGIQGAAPLGIEEHDFQFGELYTLKVGAGDTTIFSGEISPGWFGALALGGPGASTYEDNLTYGYTGKLKVGDIVDIQTGNISGPTVKAIDYRVTQDKHTPYCTVDNFQRDCTRLLKVPVIEPVDNKSVKIIGFALFLVDEVAGQGNDCYVKGHFVKSVCSGEIDSNGQDFGLVGVKLIQ